MIINNTTYLLDLIKIYKMIPKSKCENIIKKSDNLNWKPHVWANYSTLVDSASPNTECLRTAISSIMKLELFPIVNECLASYQKDIYNFKINGYSDILLNRYDVGTQMLPHHDHIHTLFSGPIKGIPILSIVGLLNDDFEGGEFVFWNDEIIRLKEGDIMIFPSLFAYSHRVNKITKGSRYSFVSWVY